MCALCVLYKLCWTYIVQHMPLLYICICAFNPSSTTHFNIYRLCNLSEVHRLSIADTHFPFRCHPRKLIRSRWYWISVGLIRMYMRGSVPTPTNRGFGQNKIMSRRNDNNDNLILLHSFIHSFTVYSSEALPIISIVHTAYVVERFNRCQTQICVPTHAAIHEFEETLQQSKLCYYALDDDEKKKQQN